MEQLDRVQGYPIYSVTINPHATLASFWINAGTHGDEPASVEAAVTFLERFSTGSFKDSRIVVTPCLNPHGFVSGRRENADGIDVNWAFDRDDVAEIAIIKRLIDGGRYEAVIDLHEDWESPGYYLYEQHGDNAPLGVTITERVRAFCPVNDSDEIEGERADRGVIFPRMDVPKRSNGTGVPVEVFRRGARHQITSESPMERPMAERVEAHLAAIDVFLGTYGAG